MGRDFPDSRSAMSQRRRLRELFLVAVGVAVSTGPVQAQRALQTNRLTQGDAVLVAFEPVIQQFRTSVVRVLRDTQNVSLGTVVSADGLILTKASEVDALRKISIQRGRETVSARVIGWSEAHDLAVLKAEGSGWTPVPWSATTDPPVGQLLVSPGPEKLPLSIGVVSVPRRSIKKDEMHGVLGIELEPVDEGAIIRNIFDNSAAAAARMKDFAIAVEEGATIVRIGTLEIRTRRQLIEEIRKHPPGETLTIEIRRDNQTLHLTTTLTHPFGDFLSRIAQQNRLGGSLSSRASGFPAAIQHDSVLKPEECGGPVVDLNGQVVGLNIARSGRTESLMIPARVIQEVLQEQQAGRLPAMRSQASLSPPPPPEVQVAP